MYLYLNITKINAYARTMTALDVNEIKNKIMIHITE